MTTAAWLRPPIALTFALALVLTACGGDDDGPVTAPAPAQSAAAPAAVSFGIDDDAVGPAPPVPGAVSGGTIRVLDSADIAHFDPARIYVSTVFNVSNLVTRTLTGYRQDGKTVTLVGDLATNTGVTKDGGKTWTYTLRDGVTWEDGSPITSADVKYGIERTFAEEYTEGPVYVQEWLAGSADFREEYAGPYTDGSLDAIRTPDAKTIELSFPDPRPDVPFALALTTGAPVKQAEDTMAKYDQRPFASGPYKIERRQIDKSMTLVRNEAWAPESDPIRYQYPERYEFEYGDQQLAQYQRIIAGNGGDDAAVPAESSVAPELLAQVTADPALSARIVKGASPFVFYYWINNKRITDPEVRKALLYAWPRQQIRQVEGGPVKGELATTISGPTLIGHERFDLYDVPPGGDPARARATLEAAGKLGQKIVYAYERRDSQERESVIIRDALTEAGFEVVVKGLSDKNYFDEIGKVDNEFDVYPSGWGFDWPSGSTVYGPLLDGRKITDNGTNFAFFDDSAVNTEIDRISALTDAAAAGKAWADLDRTIMAAVPAIPYRYDEVFLLPGAAVGNAVLDQILGLINLNGLYVKP